MSQRKPAWNTIALDDILGIERVVAEFQIESAVIPSRYFRVKVTEKGNGRYMGRCNVSVKGRDGCADWVSGLGDSVDEALEDTLQQFLRSLQQHRGDRQEFEVEDFEWTACEDF
jgi:hypothetical protein